MPLSKGRTPPRAPSVRRGLALGRYHQRGRGGRVPHVQVPDLGCLPHRRFLDVLDLEHRTYESPPEPQTGGAPNLKLIYYFVFHSHLIKLIYDHAIFKVRFLGSWGNFTSTYIFSIFLGNCFSMKIFLGRKHDNIFRVLLRISL